MRQRRRRSGRSRAVVLFLAGGSVVAGSLSAEAALKAWTLNSGSFNDPAKWDPAGAPGPGDTAAFRLPTFFEPATTVSFSSSVTNTSAFVDERLYSFALNGVTYTLSDSLAVGGTSTASLSIAGGTVNANSSTVGGAIITVGFPFPPGTAIVPGDGQLTVASTATLNLGLGGLTVALAGNGNVTVNGRLTSTGGVAVAPTVGSTGGLTIDGGRLDAGTTPMTIGASGAGRLTVINGGRATNGATALAAGAGSSATVTVSGAGSAWSTSGLMTVGDFGSATLNVDAGGMVTSNGVGIAVKPGTFSSVGLNHGSQFSSSGLLRVGDGGFAALDVETGSVFSAASAVLGKLEGSGGTATLVNPGSRLTVVGTLLVGDGGQATVNISRGAAVSAGGATDMGAGVTGDGVVNLSDSGSSWSTGPLTVGRAGRGNLSVLHGAIATTTGAAFVAHSPAASGDVTVNGQGSAWSISGPLYVGGSDVGVGGVGRLNVEDTATVTAGGLLKIWNTGRVDLSGGTLNVGSLQIVPGGTFNFNSGTLNVTASDFVVGSFGPLGASVQLNPGQRLGVTGFLQSLNVDASGLLTVAGGSVSGAGNLNNGGEINLVGTGATIGSFSFGFNNSGLLTGNGRVTSSFTNTPAGVVRAANADRLTFAGFSSVNNVAINLVNGGTVDFRGTLTNGATGFIAGRGTLVTAGMTNSGTLTFSSGSSDVFRDINNAAGGRIVVTGAATATFYDDLVHNGAEVRVTVGGRAVWLGAVSGAGTFTGTGTNYFEGDLRPGNSPGQLKFGGDVVLGPASRLKIEMAGNAPGSGYDVVTVAAGVQLEGRLDITRVGGFVPTPYASYPVLTYATRSGILRPVSGTDAGNGLLFAPIYDPGQLRLVPALGGDANLDQSVDFTDLVALAQHYNFNGGDQMWVTGDFSGDGNVDFNDLVLLAQNYNTRFGSPAAGVTGASAAFDADLAAAFATVPEPGVGLSAMALAGATLRRRRRAFAS